MFTMLPESVGSPAFFQSLLSLLAVTLLPTSLAPCLTALNVPLAPLLTAPAPCLTAPAALDAKLPAPRFILAPNVFGLSNPSSPCTGSASCKYSPNAFS